MTGRHPIAQIFCRCIEKPALKDLRPGDGFVESRALLETNSATKPRASLDTYLYPDRPIQVGRAIEDNDIAIRHPYVSRQHFTIYSIVYEEGVPPLIYVRDRHSLSGTYVDNHVMPLVKVAPNAGYLLDQNDVILVNPYWEFHVHILDSWSMGPRTRCLHSNGADLFRDRYLITERMLGSGAVADVHLAFDLKTRRQIACKIHRLGILRRTQYSPGIIRRIFDETNILSRLTHPNILKFEAAFRSSDTLYTFTELATGGDLFSMRLRISCGLPETTIKTIIWQIVEGINYLHGHNIAHRDLKPEKYARLYPITIIPYSIRTLRGFDKLPRNMLQSYIKKNFIGDLGFARVTQSGRMASEIGTVGFMAPEIYHGQSYDSNVDIWSIGAISLFLIVPAWNSLGHFETLNQDAVNECITSTFEDLSKHQHNGAYSDSFKAFVQACLVIAPSERMTAKGARDHDWFRPCKLRLEAQVKDFVKEWRPAQVVHNSVEDLDLIERVEGGDNGDTNSHYSQYFAKCASAEFEPPMPPLIKLIQMNGESPSQ